MKSDRDSKLADINELLADRQKKVGERNAYIKSNRKKQNDDSTNSSVLFKDKINTLAHEIASLTLRIENLDKQIYGKTNSSSPSFKLPRK